MSSSGRILAEITSGAQRYLRTLVPPREERIPISWTNWWHTIAYVVPLLFMAYLARRPGTRTVRMLLLPTVVQLGLRSAFGYKWLDPRLNVYNWGGGLVMVCAIAKALDYAFAPNGRLKVGEREPGTLTTPAIAIASVRAEARTKASAKAGAKGSSEENSNGNGSAFGNGSAHSNGSGDEIHVDAEAEKSELAQHPGGNVLSTCLLDALELFAAMRGLGWDYGAGMHVPRETRPTHDRRAFLRATFFIFLRNFFLLDLIESMLKLVPGVGSPRGGSIFLPNLPPLQRYALSTSINFFSGIGVLAAFEVCYGLATLVSVGLLSHSPLAWPPIIDKPWASDSLNDFWGKRWHQILRRTFLVFGGYPGKWLGGTPGMVLGTFTASGLYHECASIAMGRGWDAKVVWYFVLQGTLVILERVWRRVTGRRVRGWMGTVWVYFCIVFLGQFCVDAWHKKGLAGGMIIPPLISPTRLVLFPLLSGLTGYELNTVQY